MEMIGGVARRSINDKREALIGTGMIESGGYIYPNKSIRMTHCDPIATGTPLTVSGLEQVPHGKPCVLVVNHASYLDGMVLVAALPESHGFVAKRELLEQFIPRVYLQRLGTEFVERFAAHESVQDARRLECALRAGRT
jgi:hypothetical protein